MTDTTRPADVAADDLVAAARALGPLIEAERPRMEAERQLTGPVVAALQELGAFRMAVPRELGGPELDPMTQVRIVEELSRLDGSVGWCVMIAAAASYVPGFLAPDAARRWFGPPDACLAGQLAPTGRAQLVDGGYRVDGRFRFASGSGHATMMLAGCLVYDGDEVVRTASGRPRMCSALLRPDEVTIVDTWHTTGLAATGSNDYVVEDRFVAAEDSWDPAGAMSRQEPLYRYPPLFLVPHAGVPLGLARAAIDAVLELAGQKEAYPGAARTGRGPTLADEGRTQEALAVAEATLGGARAYTYALVEELWALLQAGEKVPPRTRALYRIMMTHSHQQAKDVISSLYDVASTSSIFRGNPLDRIMRDVLTACQHRMVHPKIYRPAGRMLLGMESGDPLV
jgi:alkylation response protein AidB-like acyl-CoA dehydrogenase